MTSQSDASDQTVSDPIGNPSYAGYEYQIAVSVWVGLELLLVKGATDAITLEPRSREDVQASLKVGTDVASAQVSGALQDYELILQAKCRSTGPWSAKRVAGILAPRKPKASLRGPARRESPLELLAKNPQRRYMFVTNEGLESSLYPHRAETLFDWPEAQKLPPYTDQYVAAANRVSVSGRLAFCPGVTFEVLEARTANILSSHGHVPVAEQTACIRDLKDAVRARLLGHAGGRWTRTDLVKRLTQHHGSLMPTRVMDHYVRPRSFEAIHRALVEHHAVVIAGPPGTGKSLTADVLEDMLRQSSTPYSVIGEERGPGFVRAQLQRPDPILFHLRDPWGGNQLMSGADRWTNELPKLLEHRSANRKFLITSRLDVLHSAGTQLEKELRPYVVNLETEDYGPARLAEIFDRRCQDLSAQRLAVARAARQRVLEVLQRPFEVDRFFVALAREELTIGPWIEDLIEESQIEAISRVVTRQVLGQPGGAECAAFLWGLLVERVSITQEIVPKLRRQLCQIDPDLRLETEGFIDFLIAGRNLRRDGSALGFYHPRVEEGLRGALEQQPTRSEIILSRLGDVLISFHGEWGNDAVLQMFRAAYELRNVQITLAPANEKRFDAFLLTSVLNAGPREVFHAFNELAVYGSDGNAPAGFARALVGSLREQDRFESCTVWKVPELADDTWQAILADTDIPELILRFVGHVLTSNRFRYTGELVNFLALRCPNLRDAYWAALQVAVFERFEVSNLDTLVSGACGTDIAELDAAIDLCVHALAEDDPVLEKHLLRLRRADELELDHWEGDLVIDQLHGRSDNAKEALEAIVCIRRPTEGVDWISTHPQRHALIPALGAVLNAMSEPEPTELQVLLQASQIGQRQMAWSVAQQHWGPDLDALYVEEVRRLDLPGTLTLETLVKIAHVRIACPFDSDEWIRELARLTADAPAFRRLEWVHAVANTYFADYFEKITWPEVALGRARTLADTYEGALGELARALVSALELRPANDIASTLSVASKHQLAALLPELPDALAATLLAVAAAAGADPVPTARRLLGTDHADNGIAAINVLSLLEESPVKSDLINLALQHSRYAVRSAALIYLATRDGPSDRASVLSMAKDRSAGVRLAFAEQMRQRRWPEAPDALVELLDDTRDFNPENFHMPSPRQAMYKVARVAAEALGAYQVVPDLAVEALIEKARDVNCDDPMVGRRALEALARCGSPKVTPVLLEMLNLRADA